MDLYLYYISHRCLAKLLSAKTNSVDVLWLIVFGATGVNIGILPEHNEILESIVEWRIVFIMFTLGFEENVSNFVRGLLRYFALGFCFTSIGSVSTDYLTIYFPYNSYSN